MNIYDRLKAGTTPLMAKFKNPKSQVTYERLQRTPDGQGGYETAWAQVGAFDAVVLPASGTEQLEAQRLESQVSHKILALYDDANGITAADRVLFDGRVFNVEAVTDIAEGEMWLKIMCREGVASGPA